jgi:bifunctional polynucleotide phosphatase/kinase
VNGQHRDTCKTKEKCVKACKAALAQGKSVVIDNTNASTELRKLYIDCAEEAGTITHSCMLHGKDQWKLVSMGR